MRARVLTILTLLAGTALQPAVAQVQPGEDVGITSAVNPDARGESSRRGNRILSVGNEMSFGEKIVTGGSGQTQILFLDESSMTVGPNSEMSIDEFAYDPSTKQGSLAMSVAKGAFRYVGGRISKGDAVEVKTPSAVIGIRGGVGLMDVGANGTTKAIFVFGDKMTVTGQNGDTAELTRPGFKVEVGADGSVSDIARVEPGEIDAAINAMTAAAPQQTETAMAIDQTLATSNVTTVNSDEDIDDLAAEDDTGVEDVAAEESDDAEEGATDDDSDDLDNFSFEDFEAIITAIDDQLSDPSLDPSSLDLPTVGTAVFSGPVIGVAFDSFNDDGREVRGEFGMVYDFGSDIGAYGLAFDGAVFSGDLEGASSGISFFFNPDAATDGTRVLDHAQLNGIIVPAEILGDLTAVGGFTITDTANPDYIADGLFVGFRDGGTAATN